MSVSSGFEKKEWKRRETEFPGRRKLEPTDEENVVEVTREEGLVMEEGDAFSPENMNGLEDRIDSALLNKANEYDPAGDVAAAGGIPAYVATSSIHRSLDEQCVGTGIDGKPLYQKTLTNIVLPQAAAGGFTQVETAHGIVNGRRIKCLHATAFRTYATVNPESTFPSPVFYPPSTGTMQGYAGVFYWDSVNVVIRGVCSTETLIFEVLLEYQKTTD
jgi:hypothetical protein